VDINLTFVGDGSVRTALEQKAKALSLINHCKFIGQVPREDVPTLIAGFDVGYSGQVPLKMGRMYLSPIKLYEYMAMAKPVIASDFEDSSRVVINGETGFIISAGNLQQLYETILAAYEALHQLNQMGEKAREIIINQHSWQTRVASLIDTITLERE
jgi:glycosyltransferase involved in cell wall biosynthesis